MKCGGGGGSWKSHINRETKERRKERKERKKRDLDLCNRDEKRPIGGARKSVRATGKETLYPSQFLWGFHSMLEKKQFVEFYKHAQKILFFINVLSLK